MNTHKKHLLFTLLLGMVITLCMAVFVFAEPDYQFYSVTFNGEGDNRTVSCGI